MNMRLYFSFGYNTKKLGLSIVVAEIVKSDLVGYGYDTAPTLISLKIRLLLFEFEIGNLFINQ